jgi:sugar transferase (PEP-CTERM system associated)
MTKIFGHYMPFEMLLLWLVEATLSFILIAGLLISGATSIAPLDGAPRVIDLAALLVLAVGLSGSAIGLYRLETLLQTRRLLINTFIAALIALPITALLAALFHTNLLGLLTAEGPLSLPRILLAWVLCLLLTRFAFRFALRRDIFTRRILVVGGAGADTDRPLAPENSAFFTVSGQITDPRRAALSAATLRRHKIWGIVITREARAVMPTEQLLLCKSAGIRIFSDVEFRERQFRRVDLDRLCPEWLVFAEGAFASRLDQATKRGFDLAVSAGMLLVTLPLMLLTALLIKLDSPGPVFYRQERVGLHGKTFMLLKFRSMRTDAEAAGPVWARTADPRVTRVGRFIRRTRIDELPQLLNVLRGEMSFVGPRPERPHFISELARAIPRYHDRAFVKPGITGWAQVNFPYGASIEDARMKLAYDLYYISHRNLFLDFLILFSTVRVILLQEGSR